MNFIEKINAEVKVLEADLASVFSRHPINKSHEELAAEKAKENVAANAQPLPIAQTTPVVSPRVTVLETDVSSVPASNVNVANT